MFKASVHLSDVKHELILMQIGTVSVRQRHEKINFMDQDSGARFSKIPTIFQNSYDFPKFLLS